MPLKVVILTQHAPLYIGPFFDHWFSKLNREHFEINSIVAFSPIFKASTWDEAKARMGMYGFSAFVKMSCMILKEKIKSKLYQCCRTGGCSSISNVALKYEIPLVEFDSPNDQAFHKYCKKHSIDLLISIACPKILKKPTLELARVATLNYHTGGLPKYRGRQPLFWAKYNEEGRVGITVHEMAPALDAGAIVAQQWVENKKEDSLHDMYLKTIQVGPEVLLAALDKIHRKDNTRLENPNEQATKYTFPTALEGKAYRKKGLKFV